ncbi:UvrD-helicase domain-containing protein [Actinokineospora inagensis]|uniref:UvrD-helicase domain-containing protein n=1 Tax=Actinokineospora inagensis TaxID=103730 RepID=UPI0003FC6925|nr:UvrD-helicase domain-containing protein [Actinokineospora inagensis]
MGLSSQARRLIAKQAGEMLNRELPWPRPSERRVLTALLTHTATGWHLFVRADRSPNTATAFLIGRGGVFAVLVADEPPDDTAARAVLWHAEQRCAGVPGPGGRVLPESAVSLVVVLPGAGPGHPARDSRLYHGITEGELPSLFTGSAARLDRRSAERFADAAAEHLTGYRRLRVTAPERPAEAAGLLEAEDLAADQVEAAQRRSFESWQMFLHPDQHAVATRHYSGPARISGPAGTGKTVVALHRLRYLARRSTGPLLFTTFVRTLPAVHRTLFHDFAPEIGDRVEFTNLHAWALDFLRSRDRAARLNHGKADDAFSRAWLVHRDRLEELEPVDYWRSEIDRVLKGRGLRTFDEYRGVERLGRTRGLNPRAREAVWALYETYQKKLRQREVDDFNDVIARALDEVTARPLENPYAAVIVDEVQDITLVGLRLLNALAGTGSNRLLLVGDGQQQVYPGGWRLSDADISVQGRGEVLRVNYRNRATVLGFAQRFDAKNQVDDLDGGSGVALRDAEAVNPGGTAGSWQGTPGELPAKLVEVIRGLPVPLGQTALIAFSNRQLKACEAILREAGIETRSLTGYRGERDDRLKIGTVHRAKGLDFQAVLVVREAADHPSDRESAQEEADLRDRQNLVAATRARDFLWWGEITTANGDRAEHR